MTLRRQGGVAMVFQTYAFHRQHDRLQQHGRAETGQPSADEIDSRVRAAADVLHITEHLSYAEGPVRATPAGCYRPRHRARARGVPV